MKQKSYLLPAAILFCAASLFAQSPRVKDAISPTGSIGIKKRLYELKNGDVSLQKPNDVQPRKNAVPLLSGGSEEDEIAPASGIVPANTTTANLWSNFLSIYKVHPLGQPARVPDPSGAVGPRQVVVATNMGVRVFEKRSATDEPLRTPVGTSTREASAQFSITLNNFFSAVLPSGSTAVHPHVRYDRLSKRWFVLAIEDDSLSANNLIMLAVSDGDLVVDSSMFTFYTFRASLSGKGLSDAQYFDVPTLGVDRHAVLIAGAGFGPDSTNFIGYVVPKTALLRGRMVVYPFHLGMINKRQPVVSGMAYPAAVNNDDPMAKKSFFVGTVVNSDRLNITALNYDNAARPYVGQQISIVTPASNFPREVGSLGALAPVYTLPIDARRGRLLQAAIFKNKQTDISSLWTVEIIGVNQSGGLIPVGPAFNLDYINLTRNASRWLEVTDIYTTTPVLAQIGKIFDSAEPSGRRAVQFFNATIAANGQGSALISGTRSAYNEHLNVFAASRSSADAPGFMNEPVKITRAKAIYTPFVFDRSLFTVATRGNRNYVNGWGDYSQTVVDPMDDQTFWTFQQYANVDDGYGIRAVQFKAPPPAMPSSLGTFFNRFDTTVIIEGTSVEGSGFFDPGKDEGGPGYNRLSVKSTGGILTRSVKFISPTKISVRILVKNKAAGNYLLIITNPDGQFIVADYRIAQASTVAGTPNGQPAIQQKPNSLAMLQSSVFPNPTTLNCVLQVSAISDFTGKVVIVDGDGKQLSEMRSAIAKGANRIDLPMARLVGGTYFALVYNAENNLVAMQKIVKQ